MLILNGLPYIILLFSYVGSHNRDFTVIYQWSKLEYDYYSPQDRERDIKLGNFSPGKPAPIDTDVYYADNGEMKVFVTIPRFQTGVPAVLGTVSTKTKDSNPIITPYPSWSWHENPKWCKEHRIVSVYRIAMDKCGRLWVLDTGRILENGQSSDKFVCPPQILIFDLETDTLIHKYEIPSSLLESLSNLVTPIVEVMDWGYRCENSFAYLADCQTYAIIVYDLKRDTSWRVTDKSMYPHPEYGTFTIAGESFELMDGVLGMSLSPPDDTGERRLFYHAMSSPTEYWVHTKHLRNESLYSSSAELLTNLFHAVPGRRHTQAPAEVIDSNGIMYFGLVSEVQMACYNTKGNDYGGWNTSDIISDNPETLQFASGVKVVRNNFDQEELWILTSRFHKVALGTLNSEEINFRILQADISDITFHKQCARSNNRFTNRYQQPSRWFKSSYAQRLH